MHRGSRRKCVAALRCAPAERARAPSVGAARVSLRHSARERGGGLLLWTLTFSGGDENRVEAPGESAESRGMSPIRIKSEGRAPGEGGDEASGPPGLTFSPRDVTQFFAPGPLLHFPPAAEEPAAAVAAAAARGAQLPAKLLALESSLVRAMLAADTPNVRAVRALDRASLASAM